MKLEMKLELLKFCSAVFNVVFLALGLSVSGFGVWILFGDSSFLGVVSSNELWVVAAGLLVTGGVVAAIAVVGLVGATWGNRFLLLLYIIILILVVLGQMFVTLVLLINRDKIERSLGGAVESTIVGYGGGAVQDRLMDSVQRSGSCCGVDGPADWLKNSYISSLNLTSPDVLDLLPCSCFRLFHHSATSPWCSALPGVTKPQYGQGNGTFGEGCRKLLSDWLQENGLTIVSMDAALILIQVLQFVVAVFLYQSFGRKAALDRPDRMLDHWDPRDPRHQLDYGEDNVACMETDGGHVDEDSDLVDPHQRYDPPDHHYQGQPGGP